MGNENSQPLQEFRYLGHGGSEDNIYSLPRHHAPYASPRALIHNARGTTSSSTDPLLSSSLTPHPSPYEPTRAATLPRGSSRVSEPHSLTPTRLASVSTLGSAYSDVSSTLGSTLTRESSPIPSSKSAFHSAPPTPGKMLRQKPPPKPPRLKSFPVDGSQGTPAKGENGFSPTPSKKSMSSLADVTTSFEAVSMVSHSLDRSLSSKSSSELPFTPRSPRMQKYAQTGTRDKVYSILAQTKEFLSHEIEPEYVLQYLRRKGVISHQMEAEIRRCRTRHDMCEFLLDIISSKGQDEFKIFCDALRALGKQGYVADFLQVLDSMVQLVTANGRGTLGFTRQRAADNKSHNGVNDQDTNGSSECSTCSCTDSLFADLDIFNEGTTFDIDISYLDVDTGKTRCFQEVQRLKQLRRPRSITASHDNGICIREEADRYIPVLSVSLYNQCLCNNRINTLAGLLENYSCVKELSIAKNHIGTEGMTCLGKALGKNRGLVKLDIRLNTIGDEGARHLADGLRRHLSLRVLNACSVGLNGPGCRLLMDGLKKSQSLLDLDLGFNELDEAGCQAVADALSANCSLRRLRMRDAGIGSWGSRYIFRALKRNARLTLLDISSNTVEDESVGVLGEVLLCNRTLREINMEKCRLTSASCVSLSRALRTNTTLRSLDMSRNALGDAGMKALAEGLIYNQHLDVLGLNMCAVGNSGFMALLESLRFHSGLTTLKLCYNNIGHSDADSQETLHNASLDSHSTSLSSDSASTIKMSQSDITSTSTGSDDISLCPSLSVIDELYERLCQVLQLNKDLKVLLWGNKFEDSSRDGPQPPSDVSSLDLILHDTIAESGDHPSNYLSSPGSDTSSLDKLPLSNGNALINRRQSTV